MLSGQEIRVDLTLPIDEAFLDLVETNLRNVADRAGLPDGEAAALIDSVLLAVREFIDRAQDPLRPGSLGVTVDLTPADLTVAIDDRGLPFAQPQTAGNDAQPEWYRRSGLDEIHWVNRGPEGLELRLVKHRPTADVTAHLPADRLTRFADSVEMAPDQEYTIRRMRPEEAVGIAQCIYRAYGYEYPNEDLYYPDRIVHLNETGELVSIVTIDQAGEVVGHYALERPGLGPVAETGQLVVSPTHGHRHLMERMRTVLEEEAHRLGLAGVYGQPVTSHTRSQRGVAEFGARVVGISLAHSPPVDFQHIRAEPIRQRESLMLCFKYLTAEPMATVYAPEQHREIISRVYDQFGARVEYRTTESDGVGVAAGRLGVEYQRGWGAATIRVVRIGAETVADLQQAHRDLVEVAATPVIYLEIPLSQAGAPEVCRAAEAEGYFFSGLGPHFASDGDVLRLQYLNQPLDTSLLQIFDPLGQELLAYIEQERARVGSAGDRPG